MHVLIYIRCPCADFEFVLSAACAHWQFQLTGVVCGKPIAENGAACGTLKKVFWCFSVLISYIYTYIYTYIYIVKLPLAQRKLSLAPNPLELPLSYR